MTKKTPPNGKKNHWKSTKKTHKIALVPHTGFAWSSNSLHWAWHDSTAFQSLMWWF